MKVINQLKPLAEARCYILGMVSESDFSVQDLSDQESVRLNKLDELRKCGINPYPPEAFEVTCKTVDIINDFDHYHNTHVKIAGRLMNKRVMGGASFGEIKDFHGKIQIYIQRDSICCDNDKTLYNVIFKKLIDLGDIVGVQGYVFKTKTGEISIHVEEFILLSKSLKPLPVVKDDGNTIYDSFNDKEQCYRQRYLDLIVNKKSLGVFKQRTRIVQEMRNFMNSFEYQEVETPILQPIYGGAAARPFKTHHNTLDRELYMRISNELYLKRLIIGGYEGVYEFSKDFRNEGMDRYHNPEFTQVELYVAYKDYKWMMHFVEEMMLHVINELLSKHEVMVGDTVVNFSSPWECYTMFEVIEKFTGADVRGKNESDLKHIANDLGVIIDDTFGYGKIVDEIFSKKCEQHLIQPTFITDYPIEMSPLAKQKADDPRLVERFELFINGKECANAFSELNDPIEQRKRFEAELQLARRGDPEAMVMDNDFINAMSYGMPPTAGVGIGIDRLTMILTGSRSIQDVIFFPQMR